MNSPNPSPLDTTQMSPPAMSAQDPLAQLQDIHLPPEIGLWPPAWGWWMMLIVTIASISAAIFFIRRKKSRNAYRALARNELNKVQALYSDAQSAEYLQAVSIILRRTALSGFGSHFNASLKGTEWLQWLDAQCPKTDNQFSHGVGIALLTGPYQKAPEFDRDALHRLSNTWIDDHRNQWQRAAKPTTKKNREALQHA